MNFAAHQLPMTVGQNILNNILKILVFKRKSTYISNNFLISQSRTRSGACLQANKQIISKICSIT